MDFTNLIHVNLDYLYTLDVKKCKCVQGLLHKLTKIQYIIVKSFGNFDLVIMQKKMWQISVSGFYYFHEGRFKPEWLKLIYASQFNPWFKLAGGFYFPTLPKNEPPIRSQDLKGSE